MYAHQQLHSYSFLTSEANVATSGGHIFLDLGDFYLIWNTLLENTLIMLIMHWIVW